jgi:hypothetical protein
MAIQTDTITVPLHGGLQVLCRILVIENYLSLTGIPMARMVEDYASLPGMMNAVDDAIRKFDKLTSYGVDHG